MNIGRVHKSLRTMALSVTYMVCAGVLNAHHSFAEFDREKPVNLQGKIAKMEWTNPHSWVYIEVKGSDGNMQVWAFEGGAPNALIRRGITKESVPLGQEVVVKGYAAKDGSFRASAQSLTTLDGRKLMLGGTAPSDEEVKK